MGCNVGGSRDAASMGQRDPRPGRSGDYRSIRNVGGRTALMLVVNSGDGRVRLTWDEEVVKAAADAGDAVDHNGYLAPYALVPRRKQ